MSVTVTWEGGQRFRAAGEGGEVPLDGDRGAGLSPTDALLAALGACMGIDIVDILTKGRQEVTACRVRLEGERREKPPRRFTAIALTIELEGRGLSRQKAERAVELSRTTYCSVWATLAPDVDFTTRIELSESS